MQEDDHPGKDTREEQIADPGALAEAENAENGEAGIASPENMNHENQPENPEMASREGQGRASGETLGSYEKDPTLGIPMDYDYRSRSRSPSEERPGAQTPRSGTETPQSRSTRRGLGLQISVSSSTSKPSDRLRKQLSVFRQEQIARTAQARHVRRRGACVSPGDSEETSNAGDLVDAEARRLQNKSVSRAYANNMQAMLAERKVILHSRKQRRKNGRRNWFGGLAMLTRKKSNLVEPAPHSFGASYIVPDGTGDAAGHGENSLAVQSDKQTMSDSEGEEPGNDPLCLLGFLQPLKWAMTVVMAVIIALLAGGIILGAYHLGQWKLQKLDEMMGPEKNHVYGFGWLLAYALPACFVASVLVTFVEPSSGGSGIPEIKAYLNGIEFPRALKFSTWVCRCVGLILVTSSGLFAGPEGPFVHIGGIVGSWFADGPGCLGMNSWWPLMLKGHRNRCEFVTQGSAMGVAAAFGSPVGGILFALEEASTFWSKSLMFRAFLGTMLAAVLAKLTTNGFESLNASGFIEFPDKHASFVFWELFPISLLGVVCGLLGGLFNNSVKRMTLLRRSLFSLQMPTKASRIGRILEVALVVFFTVVVCFWFPVAYGCRQLPTLPEAHDDIHHRRLLGGALDGPPDLSGGLCSEGQYSAMAYILLQPKEAATKALFSKEMAYGAEMDIATLLLCFFIIYTSTLITFGSAIPAGLFIPNILSGACLGRAWGQTLQSMGLDVHVGIYALMGAAGALAGFSRMTVCLAVIFMEITSNMYLLMPLILVIHISKTVADLFGPGLVDMILELNPDIHLLEDLPDDREIAMQSLTVHDACTPEVMVLRQCEHFQKITRLLFQSSFSAYPVVTDDDRLVGLVLRSRLVAEISELSSNPSQVVPVLELAEDTLPESTDWATPVVDAYRRFKTSGLSHLCVIDEHNRLVGILTRTDFARLCQHGREGDEEVHHLIERKFEAVATGQVHLPYADSHSPQKQSPNDSSHDEAESGSENTPLSPGQW